MRHGDTHKEAFGLIRLSRVNFQSSSATGGRLLNSGMLLKNEASADAHSHNGTVASEAGTGSGETVPSLRPVAAPSAPCRSSCRGRARGCCSDGLVRVWRLAGDALRPLHALDAHQYPAQAVAWGAPPLLLSAGLDGRAVLWDAEVRCGVGGGRPSPAAADRARCRRARGCACWRRRARAARRAAAACAAPRCRRTGRRCCCWPRTTGWRPCGAWPTTTRSPCSACPARPGPAASPAVRVEGMRVFGPSDVCCSVYLRGEAAGAAWCAAWAPGAAALGGAGGELRVLAPPPPWARARQLAVVPDAHDLGASASVARLRLDRRPSRETATADRVAARDRHSRTLPFRWSPSLRKLDRMFFAHSCQFCG